MAAKSPANPDLNANDITGARALYGTSPNVAAHTRNQSSDAYWLCSPQPDSRIGPS